MVFEKIQALIVEQLGVDASMVNMDTDFILFIIPRGVILLEILSQ